MKICHQSNSVNKEELASVPKCALAICVFRRWVFFTSMLFVAGVVSAGNVWYVDAVNGNDGLDGTTAVVPEVGSSESLSGPRKTLVKVMELASAGDTIYAAEGNYNSGCVLAEGNATSNRVIVKAGVLLEARGRRTNTKISGALSALPGSSRGCNVDSVRAVYFASPTEQETAAGFGGGVVKGFTIQLGRTVLNDSTDNSCGGGAFGPGLVVDCDFSENASNNKGGNVAGATLLRCMLNPAIGGAYELVNGGNAADTLFNTNERVYPNNSNSKIVNCTFTNRVAYACGVYNCLFLSSDTSAITFSWADYYNTLSCGERGSRITEKDGECRFGIAENETAHVGGMVRPLSGSATINSGNKAYYNAFTNGWTALWQAHWTGRDYAGYERINGDSIDVGCWEWMADKPSIHVDSANGDDANTGLHPSKAKETLAAAVEAVLDFASDPRLGLSQIKAAPGTYCKGSMQSPQGPARVAIPDGVKLEGACAGVTFIEGAQATTPIKNGCGVDSLRCAYLADTAILKGFTLRNGYAHYSGSDGYVYSGGGSYGKGLVVDCAYSNNTSCYRGGNVYNGTFLRCHFGSASYSAYNICSLQKMVDCVFDLDRADDNIYCISGGEFFNCTFVKGIPRANVAEVNLYNSLILNDKSIDKAGPCKFHSCISAGALGESCSEGDAFNRFGANPLRLRVDSTTFRPSKGSLVRDAGDGDGTANYRSLIANGWSAAWIAELGDRDFAGGKRVENGRVDVGAGEHIPLNIGFPITIR